jgi:hypothetical protein
MGMNPILERLTGINMSHLSTDSALRFIQEGNYIFFQTIQSGPDRLPLKLFAVDTDQQKLVLDILATEAKSPHQKTDVAQMRLLYSAQGARGQFLGLPVRRNTRQERT